jgi:hypothetical protein
MKLQSKLLYRMGWVDGEAFGTWARPCLRSCSTCQRRADQCVSNKESQNRPADPSRPQNGPNLRPNSGLPLILRWPDLTPSRLLLSISPRLFMTLLPRLHGAPKTSIKNDLLRRGMRRELEPLTLYVQL